MKKFLLVLGLFITTVLPVFAVNWVVVNPDEAYYIDTTSISKYNHRIYGRNNIYSVWLKNFNNNTSLDLGFGVGFNYNMIWYLIDCDTKETALKAAVFYDFKNAPITPKYTLNDYQLQWNAIVPGSVAAVEYNYACGGYR